MSRLEAISRIPTRVALLIALVAPLFLTCRSSPSLVMGSAEVTAHALGASGVVEVRLTVQSSSALSIPVRIVLVAQGNQFTAVVSNLAAAGDYVFTAEAFDDGGMLIAHGVAAGVVIRKGRTTTVMIYLNEVSPPPPYFNSSPLIDAITLSASFVTPGGHIALAATAHDLDFGQTSTLIFNWSSDIACGTISNAKTMPGTDAAHPSESEATWTAAQTEAKCSITLIVKDVLGLANSASFVVTVTSAANGFGNASVSAVFNAAPVISGFTADPAQIFTELPTRGVVAVLATDPENDPLSYLWTLPPTSPCTVQFGTPAEATTQLTISSMAAGATSCSFLVAVSDGYWPGTDFVRNVSTASLTLAITRPLFVQMPPVFGIAYQSEANFVGGSLVTLAVVASDPAAGELSFVWSAASGSAPEVVVPIALGLDPAFSAAATWTVPDGATIAASDLVVTVTATSAASNLQSSHNFSPNPAIRP